MKKCLINNVTMALLMCASSAAVADTTIKVNMVDDKGVVAEAGTVTISESPYGLVFTPALHGLPVGLHGFHVHENPSCDPKEKDGKMVPALAAGGHFDPLNSGKHDVPWGEGHLGDLPPLAVDSEGNATNPVLAPRLKKTADIMNRSLMVHVGGDNHADHPMPLGGGGARMACGVIQ